MQYISSISSIKVSNFIAELFILKEKSTKCDDVVKSSNIITGLFSLAFLIPVVSLVYPKIKVCPAVNTGVL